MADWAATTRLSARAILAEGLTVQGELHLQPVVAWRDGPETPLEMLNRPDAFFVVNLPTGEVVFVCKAQVAVLIYRGDMHAEPERENVARRIPLEVMITGGLEYRGEAVTELPPAHSRALDFLNSPGAFFELHTSDGTCCINRGWVRAVRPLG
jgi:hypothetical protein